MRLADSHVEWIQGELAARYTGAQPKEGLPRPGSSLACRGR